MLGWEKIGRRDGFCISIICAVLGLTTVDCGAVANGAPKPRPPEKIYASTCGYCHGKHVAPIIRGRGLPSELVIQFVRAGPRAMPAFRQTEISDGELKALAKWINKSKADPKEIGQ